ncbi:MAG: hypothetical protein MI866_09705 [Bacteroidales bacterium]|nr:hypothetical protein [Bacteroidales bacterium]
MKTILMKLSLLMGILCMPLLLTAKERSGIKLPLQYNKVHKAYEIPVATKGAKKSNKEKLKGTMLKNGQCIVFEFQVKKETTAQTENRGCVADAGFIIDGCSFIIQNNKKDLRIFAGYGGMEKAPYYLLNRFSENERVKCYILKTAEGFEWAVEAPAKTYGGTIKKKQDSLTGVKLCYTPAKGNELSYFISQPIIDKSGLPAYSPAMLHPLLKYESTAVDKYDWNEPAAKHLVLDDTKHLTDNELNGLKSYLLDYQLPTHNHMNYYFRKRMNSYMMEWVYQKDGDRRLLDKAIEVAQRAIAYRNDNFGQYPISYSQTIAPLWPNYKEAEICNDGSIALVPGASAFAGLPSITVPIRMIADHPELWQKEYNGKSYYDTALHLIDEALKTIDYTYEVFVGDDDLIRYPGTLLRKEWHGKVFIYNRVFPVLSGSIPLIEALEVMQIKAGKVMEMDKVNQAMLNYLMADMTRFGANNQYLKYPYSQAAQEKNPDKEQVEDFTHGSFDSRDFQLFFISQRYGFGEEIIKAMANTLVDKVAVGDGTFSGRMDGSAKPRKYGTPISYDGFIWYATYRPEVYDVIIRHIIDNKIAVKDGVWDAYCLYELLKLKDND